MSWRIIALLSIALSLPGISFAAELNAGFVQGLWYSNDHFFVDTPARIYVALRNNTEHDLTADVIFSDNGASIETKSISALPGRLVEAWSDWTPTYGEHAISATLTNIKIHVIGEDPETADLVSSLAEDLVFVDYDTDSDGIGNAEDSDDDGDGISDETEGKNGTDPLVPNQAAAVVTATEDTTDEEQPKNTAHSSSSPTGLERLTNEGSIDTFLSNVTETIHSAKESVDSYREKREASHADNTGDILTFSKTKQATTDISTSSTATITRSQLSDSHPSFLSRIWDGIKSITSAFYTLILFMISSLLAHPAFVECLLLLSILVGTYKLAKKLGGRPR